MIIQLFEDRGESFSNWKSDWIYYWNYWLILASCDAAESGGIDEEKGIGLDGFLFACEKLLVVILEMMLDGVGECPFRSCHEHSCEVLLYTFCIDQP